MKKTVFAAIAAIVMVSVSNIFATNNKISFQPNVTVDTTATDTTATEQTTAAEIVATPAEADTVAAETTATVAASDSTATTAE